MRKYILLSVLLVVFGKLFGQNAQNQRPYVFKVGVSYLDNYVYNGRSDSLKTPYFIPSLTVVYDSTFTINGNFYYLTQAGDAGLDFVELNASYEFNITKKLSAGIYGTKYFYNGSSNAITGNINATLGANFAYDFDLFELNIGTYFLFTNNHTDINFSPGIERTIFFGAKQEWKLLPSFYVNFSTLNFYNGFSTRTGSRRVTNPKFNNPNSSTVERITSVTDVGMKLLDYELSLPLAYENKKWGILLQPTLAFPKNTIHTNTQTNRLLANGTTQVISNRDSTPYSEKNLTSIFYTQLSIFLKF